MLDKLILNDSWFIRDNCLYCLNIHNRPVLRHDLDCYIINFDIGYYSEIKKIIPHLHKLDKPYYFVKNFAKQERRLLLLNKKSDEILSEDIFNAIKTYAMNPRIYDLLHKYNIDFIKILTNYIVLHNAFDIFKDVYTKIEGDILKDKVVYPSGNHYVNNPKNVPIIEREDIRIEIKMLERIINLNKLV